MSGLPIDNPQREVLNLFLRGFGDVGSAPLKPLEQYRSQLVPAFPNPNARKRVTARNAYTIIAAAVATGLPLTPVVILPRRFSVTPDAEEWPASISWPGEEDAIIENGAMGDLLKLGLVSLIAAERPEEETFGLDAQQIARLSAAIGPQILARWDLA